MASEKKKQLGTLERGKKEGWEREGGEFGTHQGSKLAQKPPSQSPGNSAEEERERVQEREAMENIWKMSLSKSTEQSS